MKVPVRTLVPLPDELSLRGRRRDLLRHGHGLGRAQAYGPARRRDDRRLRPGPGGAVGDATRIRDGRARDRARHRRPNGRAWRRSSAPTSLIDPDEQRSSVPAIRELTHGEGAHKTLDCSSTPEARAATAVRAVRTWGTACFVGEGGNVTLDVSPDMLRRQVTLVASWTFSKMGQADCAEFIGRPQDRGGQALHPPLEARSGRGSLQAVRHPDDRARACS